MILALNKADLNPHVTVNERTMKALNPYYRCMIHTSAKQDRDPGVMQLIECILREVPGCLRQMSGNSGFLGLKQALENMEEDYLYPEQFQKLCDEMKIRKDLRTGILSWFQDLGVAYTYALTFQQVYVLNPAWLTNGIYRLILRTPSGGFLRHSDILNTLEQYYPGDISSKTYTDREMAFILHVMRKFEISMRVTPDYAADGVEMIPMKMGKTPPNRYDEFRKDGALHLRWEAGYLPNNLIHRLMIRKYPELDPDRDLLDKCVWRTGGWFRSPDGCDALAELTDRAMDVYVRGPQDARTYMDSFRRQILLILRDLNITAKEYVFCTMNGKEGKISYTSVMMLYRRGIKEMYIEGLDEFISPQRILHENYMDAEMETRDFFISYNNSHDGARARWISDTLRAHGYTVYFQADDCRPGASFPRWMTEAISHSRVFLAVWSGAYEKSAYCQDELNVAYVRTHKDKDFQILLVRVEDVPIHNSQFASLVWLDVNLQSDNKNTNRVRLLEAVKTLRI